MKRSTNSAYVLLAVVVFCTLSSTVLADETVACRVSARPAIVSRDAAIAAAKTAWSAVYEKASWQKAFSPENVAAAAPYSATLKDGIWVVSSNKSSAATSPTAQICASDGAASVDSILAYEIVPSDQGTYTIHVPPEKMMWAPAERMCPACKLPGTELPDVETTVERAEQQARAYCAKTHATMVITGGKFDMGPGLTLIFKCAPP